MSSQSPARKALNNLSVNTLGGIYAQSPSKPVNATLKRNITDVDGVQSPPSALRFRLTFGAEEERDTVRVGCSEMTNVHWTLFLG